MFNLNLLSKLMLVVAVVAAVPAFAERMDKETHTLLIDKLERVLELMDSNSDKRVDIMLRLADLHSERARLEDLGQTEKEATADRKRSLELYQESLKQSGPEAKGKIVFQMAQLNDLNGKYDRALGLYKETAQNKNHKFSNEVVAQALTKLGDISFNKMDYDGAQKNFKKALEIKESPRKDYLKYRLAWCAFHKGDQKGATAQIADVLKDPIDMNTESDTSFREEVSRDYATFISRGKAGPADVQSVADLSPAQVRRENLLYLANELNRLGKKSAAVYVINVAGPEKGASGEDADPGRDKIEEHLKLAEIQYDIGKKELVIQELDKTVAQWKSESCKVEENCSLLKDRFKKLVVGWGKAEEKRPTASLVRAYALYNSLFAEAEMNYWAALAARQTSQFKEAAGFYRNASTLAAEQEKSGVKTKAPEGAKLQNILEGSLLGEIEVAELSRDLNMRSEAYGHYLELRPQGQKSAEVVYQRAHLIYEQGKYPEAAEAFHGIALNPKGAISLREKAAHLSLDSLVLAKNEEAIQPWATQYANEFHHSKGSFLNIAKKAVLNHVVRIIENKDSSPTQLREGLDRLAAFPVKEATHEEQIALLKNKLILAERLQDLGEANRAIQGLLAIKKLSNADRDYALSRLEWIYELTLNFKAAYKLASTLPMSGISREERILKLAMLAELSGNNPAPHYKEYLKVGTDREKVQGVIAKLIRRSGSVNELFSNQNRLSRDLLATLALEIFADHHDYKFARKVLAINGVWQTPSGKTLSRFVFLNNYHAYSNDLMSSHLSSANLKRTLDRHVALLKRTEGEVTKALNSQDWVLQVIALNDVAFHYKRFALELLKIRVPSQYRPVVLEQARIYQAKSADVMKKISDLWNDSSTIDTLFSSYEKTRGALRKALFAELRLVARVAPPSMRKNFIHAMVVSEAKPAPSVIANAKASVSQSPFDTSKIEALRDLAAKDGQDTIVAFLGARLGQIQGSKR